MKRTMFGVVAAVVLATGGGLAMAQEKECCAEKVGAAQAQGEQKACCAEKLAAAGAAAGQKAAGEKDCCADKVAAAGEKKDCCGGENAMAAAGGKAAGGDSCCAPTVTLSASEQAGDGPINGMCPIGKEPIVASAGTVEYRGRTIGICCPGCGEKFLGWDEQKKDRFVAAALAGREPGQPAAETVNIACPMTGRPVKASAIAEFRGKKIGFCGPGCFGTFQEASEEEKGRILLAAVQSAEQPAEAPKWNGDPYTLQNCPVGGGKLGSMGDPVVEVINGREVRFCCASCIPKFKDNAEAYFEKIDSEMIAQQEAYYPLEKCLVADHDLSEGDSPVTMVYRNRLVKLCCDGCLPEFEENAEKYIAKLDAAVVAAQKPNYPLDTCLVNGPELESMGGAIDLVMANRLVRVCCGMCIGEAYQKAPEHLRQIDKAWKESGRSPLAGARAAKTTTAGS